MPNRGDYRRVYNTFILIIMEIECPNCGFDDCYYNGSCYECPDCGYTWTDDDDDEDDDW